MSQKYEVVISGVAGLFPDCDDFEELISKLLNGVDLIAKENFKWTPGDLGVPHRTGNIKNPEEFDLSLFGLPRKLVEITDPTTRLSIMQGFRAVCDAGVNPNEIYGSNTAVIMTAFTLESEDECITQNIDLGSFAIIGNARTFQANRLSFFMNLKGPSYALDATWCGGIQALQNAHDLISTGLVDAAIVGSGSVLFKPQASFHYQALGKLCKDGATRSLSSDASGYVRSEACVTLFLQRAQDARRCYGTLLGARTMHRGLRQNYFADSDPALLEEFLRDVYRDAGVNPKDIAYYEACGSASRKLDANELNAAAKVFLPGRSKPLLIGAVKSNLGHTEGASAMVSLAKALIALDRGVITPNLHYSTPNPDVPALLSGKMAVVTKTTELDGDIVGITDVGVSGSTVGHIIVKRNPKAKPPLPKYEELPPDGIPRLVLLSDRNETHLENSLNHLNKLPIDDEFLALLNQLQREGVKGQLYRAYAVLNGPSNSHHQVEPFVWTVKRKPIWFLFSGMGSQWPQMGKQLMKLPAFARAVHQCHEILQPRGIDLLDILSNEDPSVFESILNCFVGIAAVQIGLVDVLNEVGIKPDGMIGHSVGELGCAYADGCLTLEQMILSAYARGKASIEAPLIKGTMAAVGKGYNEMKDLVPESIDVACHNSSTSCTLSGPSDDMEIFIKELQEQHVFAKLVNVANIAYHSRYIKTAGPLLLNYLKPIIPKPTLRSSRWLSSSNPENEWDSDLSKYSSADYYTNNLLSPVLFEETARHVPQNAIMIEIAPHGLLQAIVKKSLPTVTHIPLTSKFDKDNLMHLLSALGKLYVSGVPVDVQKFYPKVTYPVSRGTPALSPFIGWQNVEKFKIFLHAKDEKKCFENISITLRGNEHSQKIHKINGRAILPNSFFLKKVLKLFLGVKEKADAILSFDHLQFPTNAEVPSDGNLDIQLKVFQGTGLFSFFGADGNEIFACGKLQISDAPKLRALERSLAAQPRSDEEYVHYEEKDVLDFMKSFGFTIENKFAVLRSVDIGENTLKAIVTWNGSMIAFLNGLLTLVSFFHTRLFNTLHLVSEIQKLIVELTSFSKSKTQDIEVFYDSKAGVLRCPGVLIFIPKTREVDGGVYTGNTSLEVHRFVPYDFGEMGSGQSAISICYQLILENSLTPTDTRTPINTICVGENFFSHGLSTLSTTSNQLKLSRVESEHVLIQQEVPKLRDEVVWLVSSQVIREETINVLNSTVSKCFILMPVAAGTPENARMLKVFAFSSSYEEYALYWLNPRRSMKVETVKLSDNYLPVLESKLTQANERNNHQASITPIKHHLVYLYGNVESLYSIQGVLDETNKLPHHNLLRFFLGDPKVDLDEYFGRINNDMKVNLVWNGEWGSLRKFSAISSGSTSSDGPIVYNMSSLVSSTEPTVLGLTLNDVTGSLDEDTVGAFDIVNSSGIGIGWYDPLNRALVQDETLKWDKPSRWTNAEAATVPLLYSLAMSIIKFDSSQLPMNSILVNQGLSLLSQAILHLLKNDPVEVYVTVQDDEEKQQLLKIFPSLKPENIIYCSPTFHVPLMNKTKGAGVDKVVNTFKERRMIQPCSRSVGELGTLINVSLHPMVTKSTLGMDFFIKMITATGMSVESLLNLPQDHKVEIRDAVTKAIKDGLVVPFPRTAIPEDATNVDAVKGLKSTKDKVICNVVNRVASKSRTISRCSSDKNYVIVNDKSSNSCCWLELTNWLAHRGARNVTVVLNDTSLTGSNALRTASLKRQYCSLNLTIKSIAELKSKRSASNFIAAIDVGHSLSSVFILSSKNSALIEVINECLGAQGSNSDLICFGYGGEKTCEDRNDRGLKSLCVRVGDDEGDFKVVLEYLDSLINQSQRNPIVTVKTRNAAEAAVEKSHVPSNFSELQNLLQMSPPGCSFKEVLTAGPSRKHCREMDPVFIFPGLRHQALRNITQKLHYSAYEVRLAKNMSSISEMAKEVSELMSSTQKSTYTLVAEGWGGILAMHVAATLEADGKIVRLILIDAGPSDVFEWATDSLKNPISTICKYIEMTSEERMKMKKCSTWAETVNAAVSESSLSPEEKILAVEGLNLLERRLRGVISSKPPAYQMKRPCYLFNRHSTRHSNQDGLAQYFQTEAVERVMTSGTEDEINERIADEINGLVLFHPEDAANPPREDYLRVAFINAQTKQAA